MTERSAAHATYTVERDFPASRDRVFRAWADPHRNSRWLGGPEGRVQEPHVLDFPGWRS